MPLSARFNPWTPAIFTDNEFDFLTVDPDDSDYHDRDHRPPGVEPDARHAA